MMRVFCQYIVFLASWPVFAGVSIEIEHPRYPSGNKDVYQVACQSRCILEIKSDTTFKGRVKDDFYRKKITELLEMKKQGELPVSENKRLRPIMSTITVEQGKEKLVLILGQPFAYKGKELGKFSKANSLIEEIKDHMQSESRSK